MKAFCAGSVLLLVVLSLFAPWAGAEVLSYPFCDALRNPDSRSACLDYINAVSSIGKWASAVRWARYWRGSCKLLFLLNCPCSGCMLATKHLTNSSQYLDSFQGSSTCYAPPKRPIELTHPLSTPPHVSCVHADTCANITATCLLKDLHAETYGSACTPAPNSTPCEMDSGAIGTCWLGNCVGEQLAAVCIYMP